MNDFLAKEECAMVGFEESMCTDTIDVARLLLGAHIDDFVITCANQQALDAFRAHLLDAFEGTCEGALQHYIGLLLLQHYLDNTTCEVLSICPKLIKPGKFYAPTISGMPLLTSLQRSRTHTSRKAILTRILPRISIHATTALSAA